MRVFTADMNGNQERMLNVEVGGPLGYYSHFRTSGKQNTVLLDRLCVTTFICRMLDVFMTETLTLGRLTRSGPWVHTCALKNCLHGLS